MAEPSMHQILTRLAAQDSTIAALRTEIVALRRGRRPRPLIPTLIVTLFVALTPVGLLAAGPFADLDPTSPHNGNIEAIRQAGVTRGCNPPDFTQYCPKDYVTREEMASFLARLGGLGDNPPVANAATLGGKRADRLVRVARGHSAFDQYAIPPTVFSAPASAVYPAFVAMPGATVTIEAPGDGFVLVTAVVGVVLTTAEQATIRLRDITPGAPTGTVSRLAFAATGSGTAADLPTLTWVFPVSGAGAKTFALEVAQYNANPDDVLFSNDFLTALYVPFGYDGGSTVAP